MFSGNFKEDLQHIKAFAFDVDGVLSLPTLYLHPSGEFMRSMNTKDGFIMQYAARKGYPIAIITAGKSESVRKRFEFLGLEHIYLGSEKKTESLEDFMQKTGVKKEEILYMGDDILDLEVLKVVGMPTCPNDAVPEAKNLSKYISTYNGGEGCVRDVIEQVLRVQNNWV